MLPQFDYLDIKCCRAAKTKLNSLDILYKKVAKIGLDVHWQEPSDVIEGVSSYEINNSFDYFYTLAM